MPTDEVAACARMWPTWQTYPARGLVSARKSSAATAGTARSDLRVVRPPLAHRADGLRPERLRRQAGHRDHQHLERHQPLPRALQAARRGSEARRLAGGRISRWKCRRCRCPSRSRKPTTMLYRNFLAMETEELLRSYPADGAVLMGGCDKTTPALVMGAISMDLPAIYHARRADAARQLARQRRSARARTRGSTGPSCAPATSPRTTGSEIEQGIARSPGHCMTMGTASTMTSAAEALGLTLPGAASIPAADSRHAAMATAHRQAHRRDGVGGPEAVATCSRPRRFDNAVTTRARDRRLDQRRRCT